MWNFLLLFLFSSSCSERLIDDVEQNIENYVNAVIGKVNTNIMNGNQSYLVNKEVTDDFPDFAKYHIWCHNCKVHGLENETIINVTSTDITETYYNFSVTIQYTFIQFIGDINITSLTNSTRYDGYGIWETNDFKRYVNVLITKSNEGKLAAHAVDAVRIPLSFFRSGVHLPDAPISIRDWADEMWSWEIDFYTVHRLNTWMAELFMETFPVTDPAPYFDEESYTH